MTTPTRTAGQATNKAMSKTAPEKSGRENQESSSSSPMSGLMSELPLGRLREEASHFGQALTSKGISAATHRLEGMTGRLSDAANGSTTGKAVVNMAEGDSPVKAGLKGAASSVTDKVKNAFSKLTGGGGSRSSKIKVTNIFDHVDVPVSREVAYNQWTQFEDFPTFMKKVENVSQEEDERLAWKAQIFWSHRSWTASIIEQVPNERIVWKSQGEKGHVDGAITFHELAPDLTRVQMVLEYHPKGLFEHTGNIWRAQGRRARLELKHYARHISTQVLLHPDEVQGWRGEIRDGKVVQQSEENDQNQDDQNQDDQNQNDQSDQAGQAGQADQRKQSGQSEKSGASGQSAKSGQSGKSGTSSQSEKSGKSGQSRQSGQSGKQPPERRSTNGSGESRSNGRNGGSRSNGSPSASREPRQDPKQRREATSSAGSRRT